MSDRSRSGYARRARTFALPVSVAVAVLPLRAQQTPDAAGGGALGRIRGVVFDSLIRQPLEGASVSVPGFPRVARTDASGSYVLDSVPAGRRFVTFSHPALDSVGLTVLGAAVSIAAGGETTAMLATPSLRTLYQRLCGRGLGGGSPAPDSGIVFGVVADADSGSRLDGARVVASWLALDQTAERRLKVSVPSVVAETDSLGSYRACGVATGLSITIQASGGEFTSGETDVTVDPRRPITRHDLLAARNVIAPLSDATDSGGARRNSAGRGAAGRSGSGAVVLRGTSTLVGIVLDSLTNPRSGARVVVLGTAASQTTDETGRFRLTRLPAGSHTLEVRALGSALERQTVELRSGDTTWVDVTMHSAAMLPQVRVSARMPLGADRHGFERRRRDGNGHYMTAETMGPIPFMTGLFAQIPGVRMGSERGTPTLRMRAGLGSCEPYVFIDGLRANVDALLGNFRPADLVAIEVYTRGFFAPAEFFIDERCGVVVAWTKAAKW